MLLAGQIVCRERFHSVGRLSVETFSLLCFSAFFFFFSASSSCVSFVIPDTVRNELVGAARRYILITEGH